MAHTNPIDAIAEAVGAEKIGALDSREGWIEGSVQPHRDDPESPAQLADVTEYPGRPLNHQVMAMEVRQSSRGPR